MNPYPQAHTRAEDLPEQLRPVIEKYRDEADAARRLPPPLLTGLRTAGAFRLSTPRELGGFELPLASALDVLERLGRIDGPTAWVVWNLNFGFSAAFLDDEAVQRIWSQNPDPLIANSGQPGRLAKTADGYRLSGHWKIVSGVEAAEWIALVCLVDSGEPAGEAPEVRVCWVPRAEVTVEDTWQVTGMRGTNSNTVTADGVLVPREMTVDLAATPRIDRPAYRVPMVHLVYSGCAAAALGMAQAMVDEVADLAQTKKSPDGTPLAHQPRMQAVLGRAAAQLGAARGHLFAMAGTLDDAATAGRAASNAERGALRGAISHAGETARAVTTAMYEAASSSALYEPSRIGRLFRDGHAAAQHGNLSAAHYELAGRTLLGLPPAALFV
ncbi:acyl-CoA dehydrogenase family protein [Actinospica sp.]|uniref:acyl-CoA dehydrogenase family protein n=1 Tax=Actinospica sp. TaxID=1872142 RepID=UPI002C0E8709|nr:acyl-CoA dehydrogenase family protein [Actinospica sp.]HWG23793.1 acyl-CoA dehydrogenase family protein [Actinospica sp.]